MKYNFVVGRSDDCGCFQSREREGFETKEKPCVIALPWFRKLGLVAYALFPFP